MKDYLEKRREELSKRDGGFTLMEMLIVVAIIAVLIAIAIPVFTSQLEKSRDTTSIANVRSAYAESQAAYLSETEGNKNVKINKTGNKITSVEVSGVEFQGVQTGWSGANTNLPKDVTWTALTDAVGGEAGSYTLTFTYADDGTITLSTAAKA
ncbi:MAG: prepilin-type N-terminal cleavage/methylation domain-containing protein [Atopobiaceae bacterium]|nr:prepilin-type N-terminal cleavage/methylation domain-containing protein [Atopobiaceae bacterium]